jgi:hypothetical protein
LDGDTVVAGIAQAICISVCLNHGRWRQGVWYKWAVIRPHCTATWSLYNNRAITNAIAIIIRIDTISLVITVVVCETLVSESIAVVVNPVTSFYGCTVDGGILGGAIGNVGISVAVVIRREAVQDSISIRIRITLVGQAVTVVVLPVA